MTNHLPSATTGIALFAAVGTFLFGYDTGIGITLIGQGSFLEYMKCPSSELIGAISSVYTAGEALGFLVQIAIGDKLGRVRFMQLRCILVTIGTIIQTASMNLAMFICGRVIAGFAVGGMVQTVPHIYLSEVASPDARGFIGGLSNCGLGFGLMMTNWIGVVCSEAQYGQLQWRLQVSLQIPWGVVLLIGLLTFMPESPRHYIRRGEVGNARDAFMRVRRDVDLLKAEREFQIMQPQIEYESQRKAGSFVAVAWKFRRRVLVALSTGLRTALSGATAIGYFQVLLY